MYHTYRIMVPKKTEWESRRAEQFIDQLLFTLQPVVLQIEAEHHGMHWQIIDLSANTTAVVEQVIRASYPYAQVDAQPLDPLRPSQQPVYRYVAKYQYGIPNFAAPIALVREIKSPDPLAALTQTMSTLQPDERILYSLVVVGLADNVYAEGDRLLHAYIRDGSWWSVLFPQKVERYTPELQRVLVEKLQRSLFQCLLFIQIDTPHPERLSELLVVDSQMVHFDKPQFNGLRWLEEPIAQQVVYVQDVDTDLASSVLGWYREFSQGRQASSYAQQVRQSMRLILDTREIAALWHLPHKDHAAQTIRWSRTSQVAMPIALRGQRAGLCLGVNTVAGQQERVYLTDEDRATHCLLVGKSGTGKSNSLHHYIHQDIQRGFGVMVVDPHGELVRDILQCSIPPEREQDVVVLDIANQDYPIPLNPLRSLHQTPTLVTCGMITSVLYHLYNDLGTMPQTADAMENALLTVGHDTEATLRDVNRVFYDDGYRQTLLARISDDVTQEFWRQDYGNLSRGQQVQIFAPVLRRIRAFYRNPLLRVMLCHPDSLDFYDLIRQKRIALVSLKADDALIPERERHLLGALLIAQVQLAAMRGAARRERFYCYIDEVQHFVTSTLETVFSEARKFNLALITANQYLKQLSGGTLDAMLGNIGALIAFQAGTSEDARLISQYTQPEFDREALLHQDKYQAAAWIRYRGQQQPAFSLQPFAPLAKPPGAATREARLRQWSIQGYTPKHRDAVLAWLEQRYGRTNGGEESEAQFYETDAE